MNKIDIGSPELCTGCLACVNVCPRKAINVVKNDTGFLYPCIDESKCINCGLCSKVCSYHIESSKKESLVPFLAYAKNSHERLQSTSGAIFFKLANHFLSNGGVVYGAGFKNFPKLEHIRIDNSSSLDSIRGSKYTWSTLKSVFKPICDDLKNGLEVLFSGTPCQVNAIVLFCSAKNIPLEKLFTISIACLGNSSNDYFAEYIQHLSKKNKITNYFFRKHYGTSQIESVIFDDGNEKLISNPYGDSVYMRPFFRNLSFRTSCYNCVSKHNNLSDLLIGDYWEIEKFSNDPLAEKPNICIPLSKKGNALIEQLSTDVFINKQISLGSNPYLFKSVPEPNQRNEFVKTVASKGFVYASKSFCPQKKTNNHKKTGKDKRRDIKRICLLTQNDMSNYGNRFQNIALSLFLSNNFKVKVKTCWPCFGASLKNRLFYSFRQAQYVLEDIFRTPFLKWIKRRNGFAKFNKLIKKNRFLLSPIKPFSFLNKSSDFFILGSDQVWNSKFGLPNNIANLAFTQPWKRITYAVSCGSNTNYLLENKNTLEFLPFFNNISVRESEMYNYLSNERTHGLSKNIDPTFLLDKNEWNNLYHEKVSKCLKKRIKKEYLLVYWLGNQTDNEKKVIDEMAASNCLDVIYLRTNTRDKYKTIIDASPFDFLYLLDNAKFVISKSFHGAAMSIIFNKEFLAVTNLDKNGNFVDSRFATLFEMFGISKTNHILHENNILFCNDIDWNYVNNIILKEKEKALLLFQTFFTIK